MKRLFLIISMLVMTHGGFCGELEDKQGKFEAVTGEAKAEISKTESAVTLNKWGGESALNISYLMPDPAGTLGQGQVKWTSTDQDMKVYPATTDGDEGVEIEVIIKNHPASNIFTFHIDRYQDLDFRPQPALDQEDYSSDSRVVSCTPTDCIDDQGTVVRHRPENVVDSIAIYHKTKRDYVIGKTNYGTGKVGHIYRHKITAADGQWTWCIQKFDPKTGNLNVTVPQDFLDSAVYPLSLDPTIGSGGSGASTDAINNFVNATQFTAPANGDGTTAGTFCAIASETGGTLTFMGALYTGGASPDSKSKISGNATLSITGGKTTYCAAISGLPAFVNGTGYYLAVNGQTNGTMYYDSGGTTFFKARTHSNDMPDPYPAAPGSFSGTYGLYATYTSPVVATQTTVRGYRGPLR